MKLRHGVILSAAACLLLAGCGKGGKEPTGQVVATVNGEEITAIDLRNEMGAVSTPDAATRKAAERAALAQIIERKLLVHAAEEQKLDKSPEYVQEKRRVDEAFLVRFWQNRIAKSVPPPSKDEIDRFITANPDLYAQHKVFVLTQIRTGMIRDPKLIEELKPLNTLSDVANLLTAKGIRFQQGNVQMDSLSVPPPFLAQILKLPPEDVFVIPQGNILTMNQILEVRVIPVPPEVSTRHASQQLTAQRTQQAIQRELGSALARAAKEKDAVKYAKAYEPPPAKAGAVPAKK